MRAWYGASMRAWRIVAILMLCAAAGCRSFHDPPAGWQGDFTAEVVLARASEALATPADGTPATDYIANIEVRSANAAPQDAARAPRVYAVLWKSPGLWRIDRIEPDGTLSQLVFDGTTCAEVQRGAVVRSGPELLEIGARFNRLLFVVPYFASGPGEPAELEGVVQGQDGALIELVKRGEDGRAWRLSLHADTLQPAMLREHAAESDAAAPPVVDVAFDDFGPDGLGGSIPRRMRAFAAGQPIEETRVTQFRWNQGLREQDFTIPR
jgi:hypothetical protein